MADAVRKCPDLGAALAHWRKARIRLGLDELAEHVGALLLCASLDEASFRALTDPNASTSNAHSNAISGPTRTRVTAALADVATAEQVAHALADLEDRQLLRTVDLPGRPWFAGEVSLDARVRAYCLRAGRISPPTANLSTLGARQQAHLAEVRDLLLSVGGRQLLLAIRGGTGSGRDFLLDALLTLARAHAMQRTCYELRGEVDPLEPELSGLVPVWDARQCDPSPEDLRIASGWLARAPGFAVVLLDRHQDAPESGNRRLVLLDTDASAHDERTESWQKALVLAGAAETATGPAAALLARRCRAGIGLAVRAARMPSPLPDKPAPLVLAVEEALTALSRPSSTRGLVIERPQIPLGRVISSEQVAASLDHLLALARLGPDIQTVGRKGVKALFSGPSGTGKTMAARAVATELCLPLFRVDLSAIVSKWVGETEKNLRYALEAAEAAGAVLLFDEGDALMSKRGEVTRGSDRYANLEVSYLLQAVESHDGIVIVTTNLRSNIDTAFTRRFDVSVEFALPTRPARALLWTQELGSAADALRDEFRSEMSGAELSGGEIASAARLAIALCRRRGEAQVDYADVCTAIAAELSKKSAPVQAAPWLQKAEKHARPE